VFDISFGQLLLVLIIGLVVLGPERLPIAIKTVARWIKVLRRMSATVQLELNKELKLQELQDSLKKAEQSGLKTLTPELQESIDDLKRVTESIQKEIDSVISTDTNINANKDKS
jgi:twin arginine-targeting protein translocase TatB